MKKQPLDIMRLGVIITIALAGLLLSEANGSVHSCVQYEKPRTKPREIRGFKPEYISTAIGFGKREISKQNGYEKIMLLLLQNSPESIPVNWFLQEIRKNPELARRIARKIVESEDNGNKLSAAELFKSERTISFF